MIVHVNGNRKEIPEGTSILQLLTLENIEMPDYVSVELNEEILAREVFSSTIVQEDDQIEFLYFMGGGSDVFYR